MKTLIIIVCFIIIYINHLSSTEFEFTPINIDFNGIVTNNDLIIAYGNYGSILIRNNDTETLKQVKVFEHGNIINLFIIENKITAFNEKGIVASSFDSGKNWNVDNNLHIDSLLNVIKYNNGYFLRTSDKLITLNEDFEINNEYPLPTKNADFSYGYKSSITFFKEFLIAETDSSKLIIFDKYLLPLDTISFYDFSLCKLCRSAYQIYSDSTYFYNLLEGKIFRTSDFKKFEFVTNNIGSFFKPINNSLYFLSIAHSSVICYLYQYKDLDSIVKLLEYRYTGVTSDITINDFVVKDSILLITGDSKFVASINLNDSSANIYSCISRSQNQDPYKINDSSFIFFKGYHSGLFDPYIYQSNDNGIIFKPTINPDNEPKITSFKKFIFSYIDTNNKSLIIGAQENFLFRPNGILMFHDYGSNFSYMLDSNLQFDEFYYQSVAMPKLIKRNNNFIIHTYNNYSGTIYNKILTLSNEFELVSELRDSDFAIRYIIESLDTNSFLINCYDMLDSATDFRFTTNKGQSWEVIKNYSNSDSTLYYKEFEMNHRRYFAFFYFNIIDSIFSVDVLDAENLSVFLLYSFKVTRFYQIPIVNYLRPIFNYGIVADLDTLYLAIDDTLFFTTDLYHKTKWKFYVFPNNGYIDRSFKKFDNKFYAYYADDFNKPNSFWIQINEDIIEPLPIILADDIDFGQYDISNQDSLIKTLKIFNNSPDTDLIISGYSQLNDSVFSCNLPETNVNNPIVINSQNYYEFEVHFKPKEAKKYSDSIVFYSNAVEIDSIAYLNGEGIDDTTSINEFGINYQSYLYCYPPYPIPATNTVRSLIYWDTSIDIENDEIAVYDIFGHKIAGRERITIDKQNAYSGILTWDSSKIPDGIYLIRIIHGTKTWTMKVIVNR